MPDSAADGFIIGTYFKVDGNWMKTVDAHFDGKQIVLDEPMQLTVNTKLKVIVAEQGESFSDHDLSQWVARLSEPAFAKVWDNSRDADYDKL